MRVTRSRMAVGLLALGLLAGACSGDSTEDPTASGTGGPTGDASVLVVGTTEKPSAIDPARVYEKMASDFLFNSTDRLVELEPGTGDAIPGVASEWDISDDGLTYTFTLRDGVTFQDGSDLTSEDVKWSLERALNINHPQGASFLLSNVASVEAPDDLTVVVTLASPNVTFLSRLAYTVGTILPSDGDVYTAPEARLGTADAPPSQEEADAFLVGDQIVGSGPYQMTSYDPDQGATFETWDGYWGDAPGIPTVRVEFFETTAQMAAALQNGEIDMNVNDFGPAERAALEGDESVTVEQGDGGRIRYMVFDTSQAPFDDPAVRRSISAAVDRQRIIDDVFEGAGTPLYSMVPPAYPASADEMSSLEPEVEGDPIAFDLWIPLNKYGDTEEEVGESIARSLNESGLFDVTVQSADWVAEYADTFNTGAYGAFLLGWYPDYIDPDDYIEPFYHSAGFIGLYESAEMDGLIADEQLETDADARTGIFGQIQELAATDMPYVPLYEESFHAFYANGLSGVENSIDIAGQARWYMISR